MSKGAVFEYGPARDAQAVTPSDSAMLTGGPARGFMIGGAGNIKVLTTAGTAVTITAPAVGVMHHLQIKQVFATGTTATNIVALY